MAALCAGPRPASATEAPGATPTEPDYWKDVDFSRADFEEVRTVTAKRHADEDMDESWAFAQSATFAVAASSPDRPVLLLPEAFVEERKQDPREHGGLRGATRKIAVSDRFVLLTVGSNDGNRPKQLTPDEINAERKWRQDRARALRAAWAATGFGPDDFNRVMVYLTQEPGGMEEATPKAAWIAAARGFLFSLDPHCSLVPKAAWDDSTMKSQDPGFEGIGAVLAIDPVSQDPLIEVPIHGQPSDLAGLRAGDRVIQIDGITIRGESLSKVASRIRGPRGTPVVLTVRREGKVEPDKIEVIRGRGEVKNVQGRLIAGHAALGYVKVRGFVRSTDEDLAREIERLGPLAGTDGLRGLVLDLRDNSGGLLNQGIKLGNRFLDAGTIATIRNRNPADNETYAAEPGQKWNFPLVVLVNSATASAAEVVAAAFQDNQRAIILGDRTFGKATVQTLYSPAHRDDYYIKLTIARYHTPSGRKLSDGVVPDITIPLEPDGRIPVSFREENKCDRPDERSVYASANEPRATVARAWADQNGIARKLLASAGVADDWQVLYSADILESLISGAAAGK